MVIFSLEEIKESYDTWKRGNDESLRKILISIEEAIPHVKRVYVKDSSIHTICNGAPVRGSDTVKIDDKIRPKEIVGIFSPNNKLIAFGIAKISSKEMHKRKGTLIRTDRVIQRL